MHAFASITLFWSIIIDTLTLSFIYVDIIIKIEPFHEKTNIVDPDQPKFAARANPDRHFSTLVDFLFQESLLYTSISQRRNVSTRITLRGLRRVIWVDTLRRAIMLVFSWNGSYVHGNRPNISPAVLR